MTPVSAPSGGDESGQRISSRDVFPMIFGRHAGALGCVVAALLAAGCQASQYSDKCPANRFSQCIGLTPGSANTQFNGNGIVSEGNTTGINSGDSANAIAFDASGRLVVTGVSVPSPSRQTNLVVWRFLPDGTLDATFGPGGFVTHTGTAVSTDADVAQAAFIDGQGNIALAGSSRPVARAVCPVPPAICPATPMSMALWRYTPTGALDSTFNAGGIVANNATPTPTSDGASGLVLDPLGNLIAVGEGSPYLFCASIAVWRYTPGGTTDPSFNGGTAYSNNVGTSTFDGAFQGVLDADGHLLATGFTTPGSTALCVSLTTSAAAVWELDPALTPPLVDSIAPSSATGGTSDTGLAVALDASGRVLVAGYSLDASGISHMALWRFTRNPLALDRAFGGGRGYVTTLNTIAGDIGEQGNAVLVDFAGRIVVAGYCITSTAGNYMTVWRFNGDGTPDLNFGGQGFIVQTSTAYPATVTQDQANAMTMDANGHLYVAGSSANGSGPSYMVVWSFNP